jgi:hypothetical protein
MQLLGEVHGLKPTREGALEITRHTRLAISRARFEFRSSLRIAITARDREAPIAFDEIEQRLAALIAQHLADKLAEYVDVVTQRGVFLGELDFGAFHA